MIYGDNPQKINERQDTLGLTTYTYFPQITAVLQSGNLYVYTVNNPLLYTDPTGELLNAIVGGVICTIAGGMSALVTGENVYAGMAEGAASGLIAGAAVDLAIATVAIGGVAGVAVAGVLSFGGGFLGSLAGQQVNSLIAYNSLSKINFGEVLLDGFINMFAFGASGIIKYADEGLQGFNHSKKLTDIFEKAFFNPLNTEWIDIVSIDATIKISTLRALFAEML